MEMLKEIFRLPFHSADFMWIFLTALLVILFKTVIKFITKLSVFLKQPPDPSEIKAAKFDCLRLGLDLTVLGLVTIFAVFRLALKIAEPTRIIELYTLQTVLVMVQLVLVALATFVTAVFHSPEKEYVKGIFWPFIFGWLSLYTSAVVYRWLLKAG